MPNIESDVAMSIVSPFLPAGLPINQQLPLVDGTSYCFLIPPASGYQIIPGKFRSVVDSISQADGSSLQQPYIDGLVAAMTIEYWETIGSTDPAARVLACGQTARLMDEMLMGVLNSLREWTTDPNNEQRYIWTPTGAPADRLLTNVLLASWPTVSIDAREVRRSFSLGTPFPYAIDIAQLSPTIADGTSAVLTNNGNAKFSPVMQVQGPTTVFLITNEATGEIISYDGTRPGAVAIGGGDYAEIDFFQGSIFLNGSGADLVAGLDPVATDFFTLAPGDTTVSVTGADVVVLYNHAFC